MSFIEEEFDDDTEIPLPTHTLANRGPQGPILQEIDSDEEDEEEIDFREMPSASSSSAGPAFTRPTPQPAASSSSAPPSSSAPTITRETTKRWMTVYPIYIDAKRPIGKCARRIPRKDSVWWPLSGDMAQQCARLGFRCLHDPVKSHPKDWENTGRVKVLFKENGKPLNPYVKNKKQLLVLVSRGIQAAKPQLAPDPKDLSAPITPGTKPGRTPLPHPPEPLPPLSERYTDYSPVIESGMLVESVKNALAAEKGQVPGVEGVKDPMAGGKGKRKVIRVRA